ncbi:CGNR zinc finger domain-containing protein [Zhihengliuella sp. ISTPL4]|uniref:CGNR zinc finger domain-containing protein n=1 Tax=Zhihengliuella sp. ISTPL4 TaxID=2058657 RepID=UPI000C7A2409|nr:CGNR zinc finger domain-containing protein [Zhihengliuella sp. ISTPL4]
MDRPLRGEPLALDLVNTAWVEGDHRVDLFDDPAGVSAWLAEHRLPGGRGARAALVRARDAIRAAVTGDTDPLGVVLAHGSRRPGLRQGVPSEEVIVDDPDWHAAWVAAADLVRLYGERPERIRPCANPECVLWFYDTSKSGQRRWCSMQGCGNRMKAARFYDKHVRPKAAR